MSAIIWAALGQASKNMANWHIHIFGYSAPVGSGNLEELGEDDTLVLTDNKEA